MIKKFFFIGVLITIVISVIFGSISPAFAKGGGSGGGRLTEIEIAGLFYMREEEKLAHDVYVYLYSLYGVSTFANISFAEQNHTAAILKLLNYYDLTDPASPQPGVFTNQNLQDMYNTLITWGSEGLESALRVGGTIEEVDILDLEYYSANTNKSNILQVYGNLKAGSENHLRAFVSRLSDLFGVVYVPIYLSPEQYQQVIIGGGNCRRCGHP